MSADERRALEALRELPMDDDSGDEYFGDINLDGILDGSQSLDISHAGGEFETLAQGVGLDICKRSVEFFHIIMLTYLFVQFLPSSAQAY
jgi:hypothetical protein